MNVWNVIEATSYIYEGEQKHLVRVSTCLSEEIARKVILDMEREFIVDLYSDSDETERTIEEHIKYAQVNHEFVFADSETTTWEIQESEVCYE